MKLRCERCGQVHYTERVESGIECRSVDCDGAPCGGTIIADDSPDETLYRFQQETIAAFKPVQEWYDGDGQREWVPEMIGEAVQDLRDDREAIVFAIPRIKKYVEWFGAAHEDECPGDSACSCACKEINDGINEAIAKLEGKP